MMSQFTIGRRFLLTSVKATFSFMASQKGKMWCSCDVTDDRDRVFCDIVDIVIFVKWPALCHVFQYKYFISN